MQQYALASLALVMLLSGCSVSYSMPENAVLLVNPQTGEYISPPCRTLEPERYATFTLVTTSAGVSLARAEGATLRYEPRCRDAKFRGPDRAMAGPSGGFTESAMLNQKSSRWKEDGSWNW